MVTTGAVVGAWDYSMFGVVTTATGGASGDGVGVSRFLFAGEYLDDTGLYYLRARFYDPLTASFVSVDPALSVTGSPYAYASGNPLQLVDPLGLWPSWGDIGDGLKSAASATGNWISGNAGMVIGVGCVVFAGFFGYASTALGAAEVVGTWYWDRESTYLQYTAMANWRRLKNPLQTAWDVVTLTAMAEDIGASYQIGLNDAELLNEGRYCGREGECFTGGRTPNGSSVAITFGHNVTWGVNAKEPDEDFVEHEFQHVYDYEGLGGLGFGYQYGKEYLQLRSYGLDHDSAYRSISFEWRARAVAADPDLDARNLWLLP